MECGRCNPEKGESSDLYRIAVLEKRWKDMMGHCIDFIYVVDQYTIRHLKNKHWLYVRTRVSVTLFSLYKFVVVGKTYLAVKVLRVACLVIFSLVWTNAISYNIPLR